ncbi:hypothetical protein FB451DRAFT_1561229, partial [Mycena latifolia]
CGWGRGWGWGRLGYGGLRRSLADVAHAAHRARADPHSARPSNRSQPHTPHRALRSAVPCHPHRHLAKPAAPATRIAVCAQSAGTRWRIILPLTSPLECASRVSLATYPPSPPPNSSLTTYSYLRLRTPTYRPTPPSYATPSPLTTYRPLFTTHTPNTSPSTRPSL